MDSSGQAGLRASPAAVTGKGDSEEAKDHCATAAFGPWLAESLKCFHEWMDTKMDKQLHAKVSQLPTAVVVAPCPASVHSIYSVVERMGLAKSDTQQQPVRRGITSETWVPLQVKVLEDALVAELSPADGGGLVASRTGLLLQCLEGHAHADADSPSAHPFQVDSTKICADPYSHWGVSRFVCSGYLCCDEQA